MPVIHTPEAILSYPFLFTPRANDEGTLKYSCSLVFPAGTDLAALKQAVLDAAEEKFGSKAAELIKTKKIHTPFRDDWAAKGYPEGSTFINVTTTKKPGIVSIYKGADGKPAPITESDQVYAGCRVIASIVAKYFEAKGKKGITFYLNNLQKRGEGGRLDGRMKAEDEFEAEEAEAAFDGAGASGIDDLM
ncbi:DUF2815 family protein [Paraburkholderia sp. RL18-103-BIB-C]|uniref:ssDNA-binding protein n=1 Tax=Paraburkholderia sp. RL18-103-BIB-C TaxID=3031637 RepID=UPI0038BD2A3E